MADGELGSDLVRRAQDQGGQSVKILREFAATLTYVREVILEFAAPPAAVGSPPEDFDGLLRLTPIETADETLKRAAEPEIVNEILAGGAVAASFTATASIAKAHIEAKTQRRKNELDSANEQRRIESNERIAGMKAMTGQLDVSERTEVTDGEA